MNEKKFNNLYNNIKKKDLILYNNLNNNFNNINFIKNIKIIRSKIIDDRKKYIYLFINDIIINIKKNYYLNLINFNDTS